MKIFNLKRLDLFGRGVSFKTADDKVNSTWLGLFFSTCLIVIVSAYASFKFIVMITHEDTSVTEKIDAGALDRGYSFGQKEGFRFAFSLYDLSTN